MKSKKKNQPDKDNKISLDELKNKPIGELTKEEKEIIGLKPINIPFKNLFENIKPLNFSPPDLRPVTVIERKEFLKEENKAILEDVNSELSLKSFDEKIEWFTNNYERLKQLRVHYSDGDYPLEWSLTGENFLCFVISAHKRYGRFTSKENSIEAEIEYLKQLIQKFNMGKTREGFTAFELLKAKENLAYLESLKSPSEHESQPHFQKLKWNGQHNILIDVFYQMKHLYNKQGQPLLPNSNEEVAIFLKNNFDCFKETKISTIVGELKKSDRPRKSEKRIMLNQDKSSS